MDHYRSLEGEECEDSAPRIDEVILKKSYGFVCLFLLSRTFRHLEHEGRIEDLTSEQGRVLDLLKQFTVATTRVPGSQAAKLGLRNEIRNYFGYFGLPQIYFTFNPSAVHSPVFQVIFGDRTVDLNTRYPVMPEYTERAERLAKDPVAAADFFDFMFRACFEHLFGWDFDKCRSKPEGGILGRVYAWIGASELTERACFHGHFVLWLALNTNPTDIHQKLESSEEYARGFFDFYEASIFHHLPDVERIAVFKDEPRIERPPAPPKDASEFGVWRAVLLDEVKCLGELFQRHICKPVCEKYGNIGRCRFKFPHDIELLSRYDASSHSIIFQCLDAYVNYFNDILLVYCRHNHDIRCILSGQGAYAAMFYITDYITKMEQQMHQVLTLLSKAVSALPEVTELIEPVMRAREVLLKCSSFFLRRKQIHGQQAARYLRGLDDGMRSHVTVPMYSNLLLFVCRQMFLPELDTMLEVEGRHSSIGPDSDSEDENEERSGDPIVPLEVDSSGRLQHSNQAYDYIYRDDALKEVCFYEFVRCFSRERNGDEPKTERNNCRRRFLLKEGHPCYDSVHLVEHTNDSLGYSRNLVPRVVGCSIPRRSSGNYPLFALAHFKPFSSLIPLIPGDRTVQEEFNSYVFNPRAVQIMKNWDSAFECQDQRDAERMTRRRDTLAESLMQTMDQVVGAGGSTESNAVIVHKQTLKDRFVKEYVDIIGKSNWFTTSRLGVFEIRRDLDGLVVTPLLLRQWKGQVARQEAAEKQLRRNALNPESPQGIDPLWNSERVFCGSVRENPAVYGPWAPPTISTAMSSFGVRGPQDLLTTVSRSRELNHDQDLAFRIIVGHFLDTFVRTRDPPPEQLIMKLAGPVGTGKTYVANSVKEVMSEYQMACTIRYLAPTGTAAALIDGMTVHKGLSINIKANKGPKYDRSVVARITVKDKETLRTEWKNVNYVLLDEVSMVSCEIIAEVDSILRFVKERVDVPFGGVNVIFSGDFCQFPPVQGAPLYKPIDGKGSNSDSEMMRRLGRNAWKRVNTVVELTEQKRMSGDPEFAAAVNRLRLRSCTQSDVDMFNSRVIKSDDNPSGVDLGTEYYRDTCLIVRTNAVRQALNMAKARSNASAITDDVDFLVLCSAYDKCDGVFPASKQQRVDILQSDVSEHEKALPGVMPLYVGMPVILKHRNVSVELKVTNGSVGVVRAIHTRPCPFGFTYCEAVIVEFPGSKVKIEGLHDRQFPVVPITWSFNYRGDDGVVKVKRRQLPVEPAFAITGYGAQGRTLDRVTVPLHEGGFVAYVGASRPRKREDLTIVKKVRLEELNRPLSRDLQFELMRLKVLAHNTAVKYGWEQGEILSVPDPESESCAGHQDVVLEFDEGKGLSVKRKGGQMKGGPPRKRVRRIDEELNSRRGMAWIEAPCGPVWDSVNYSCAYDCALVSMLACFGFGDIAWREAWSSQNAYTQYLGIYFQEVLTKGADSVQFDELRDGLRDLMFAANSRSFPRWGMSGAAVGDVLLLLCGGSSTFDAQLSCPADCGVGLCVQIPECPLIICSGSSGNMNIRLEETALTLGSGHEEHSTCIHGVEEAHLTGIIADEERLVVVVECEDGSPCDVIPEQQITFTSLTCGCNVSYDLRAVIFFGGAHYTCRLFSSSWSAYYDYDGTNQRGRAVKFDNDVESSMQNVLRDGQGRRAKLFVYAKPMILVWLTLLMSSVASLQELFEAVNALPTKAGKNYFSYLAPLSNNPRRLPQASEQDTFYVFVDTYGNPARFHTFMKANTRPSLSREKSHTQLGEYFNLFIEEGQTYFPEDKLKICRALICAEGLKKNTPGIPPGIISMSQDAIKCCMKLQTETEHRFNRSNLVMDLQAPLVRPSRTGDDSYILLFQTNKSLNLGATRGQSGSCISGDPFDQDELCPSFVKQSRINQLLKDGGIDDPLFLDDLSDPQGLWENTIRGMNARRSILVEQPKIYNSAGELVHPSTYEEVIWDGQLMFAECSLSMWNFDASRAKPKKPRAFSSKEQTSGRVYHITIEELHLLDLDPDEHKAWLIDRLGNGAPGYVAGSGEVGSRAPSTAPSDGASSGITDKTIDEEDTFMAEPDFLVGGGAEVTQEYTGSGGGPAVGLEDASSSYGLVGSSHAPSNAGSAAKRGIPNAAGTPNKRKHVVPPTKKDGVSSTRSGRNARKN